MDKILIIINQILIDNGQNPLKELKPELSLMDDIGFDSLDLATLTVKIESETGIDIFEDEIVTTIKQILDKIQD